MKEKDFHKVVSGLRPMLGKKAGYQADYSKYQADPAGFCETRLKQKYTDDIKTLMETVRDHEVVIAKSANAVGKTHAASSLAIWFRSCFPDAQVYTAAAPPEGNLRRLLWGEIREMVQQVPELFHGDRITDLHIEQSPKAFLTGVTIPSSGTSAQREAKFSGKHAPNLMFIFDEGDAIPDDVYRAVETCMSGGYVKLLVLFNPRAKSGEVYRMERDERAKIVTLSALTHPNVVTGEDVIPGAVTREKTVRRINEYCRPVADGEKISDNCFELPEYLVGAVAARRNGEEYSPLGAGWYYIVEPAFSYMCLAKYPARNSTQLISWEWIIEARVRYDEYVSRHGEIPPRNIDAVMGLDVAEFGEDSNVAFFRYGSWVAPPVSWGDVDVIATGARAGIEYGKRKVSRCNVDGTGVGAGVAPYMARKKCKAYSIKVASSPTRESDMGEFAILRDQLWWALREWLRTDPEAMLPPDERLAEELSIPTYSTEDGKVRVMKKKMMKELLKRSPDRADALCLTFAPTQKIYRDRKQRWLK